MLTESSTEQTTVSSNTVLPLNDNDRISGMILVTSIVEYISGPVIDFYPAPNSFGDGVLFSIDFFVSDTPYENRA